MPLSVELSVEPTSPLAANGPCLLLLSLSGLTIAAGTTLCRLLLAETGAVLLLLSDNEPLILEGIDSDFMRDECPNSRVAVIGKILVSASSSAYLRSVPLLLEFVSSAAMVVGVFLTGKQLR
jgi:hypothetical protein